MSSRPDPDGPTPDIWQLHIEQRGDQWALCSGDPPAPVHVVSYHATRAQAEEALRLHDASGDRGTGAAGS
jgi:hypothetical protein